MCRLLVFFLGWTLVHGLAVAEQGLLPKSADANGQALIIAPTMAMAWRATWKNWADRYKIAPHAPEGQIQDELIAMLPSLELWVQNRELSPAALMPIVEMLADLKMHHVQAAERLVGLILGRVVTEPFGDRWRQEAVSGSTLVDDREAVRMVVCAADAWGGPQRQTDLYRMLLESKRADLVGIKEFIEQRFKAEPNLTTMWLARYLRSPPEEWDDTMREHIDAGAGTVADRQALLQQIITLALVSPVASVEATEERSRVLLSICSDPHGRWDGMVTDESLAVIEKAVTDIDDVRKVALPWLIILHSDPIQIQAALRRQSAAMVNWSLQLDLQGRPMREALQANVKTLPSSWWRYVVPVLPLVMTQGISLTEANQTAAIAYQSYGIMGGWGESLDSSGRVTKAAIVAMLANDEEHLRTWWKNPAVHCDVDQDQLFRRVLAPWAFSRQVICQWQELPLQPVGLDVVLAPPSQQWAMLARSGPSLEAYSFLNMNPFGRCHGLTPHHLLAIRAISGDPSVLATFTDIAAALPTSLPKNDDEAAELIELHTLVGRITLARQLADEAGQRLSRVRWSAVRERVARNRPELALQEREILVRSLLPYEPWTWSSLHTRVFLLLPNHQLMQETVAALQVDQSPIANLAKWILAAIKGNTRQEFPQEAYLSAGRDPRLSEMVAALVAISGISSSLVQHLNDPRILRGWCMGLQPQLGSEPHITEQSMITLLAAISSLRLRQQRAGNP